MAENDSVTGLAITIPEEVFTDLDKLEGKIKALETTTNAVSKNIVAAFRNMANGVSPFSKEVERAEGVLRALGKVNLSENLPGLGKSSSSIEKAASSMVEMANAANRMGDSGKYSAAAWQGLQKNIEQLENRQKSLLSTMKQYESTINRIQSGGSGRISRQDTESYKTAQQEYALNEKTIASYREKQQAIIDTQQALHAEYSVVQSLRNLENRRTSLPEQRSRDELARMNEYYREMERTSAAAAKAQEKAAEKEAKARDRAAAAAEREAERKAAAQAKIDSRLRRLNYQDYVTSPEGALRTAEKANTYNQRAQAMKNLEAAIKNLDKNDKDYGKTLDQLTNKYKRLKNQQDQVTASMGQMQQRQSNLMDISGQLMRRLALVFSVSQVTHYVQKLAQVRGEFELQNAALTAIMQNKDEADKLFGQITELAVQSPFQLKELVTYTKELAAYRIENEKLYDTTKMLADVSAGLGVDMSRLILAYGQVKAANYLRGTELRQFSEAGINMLGELATYFSEIENRAVSVGEVFEMVSNRMVTFGDVEEIFKRITSDGGIFANMQEVQSRTLAGLISNLKDNVDIMLNDIGQSTESVLKDSVRTMGDLLANWREVAQVIKELIIMGALPAMYGLLVKINKTSFGKFIANSNLLYRALDKIDNGLRKIGITGKASTVALKGFQTVLGGLATAGAYAAIIALVGWLTKLWQESTKTRRELKRLDKEVSNIASTDFRNVSNSVVIFKELVNRLKDVNKGSGEHRDIISQLNSKYGEYIGYIVTEQTSYEQLKDSIDAVTESMIKRARMATEEKALQKIYEQSSDDIKNYQERISTQIALPLSRVRQALGRDLTTEELAGLFAAIESKTKELGRKLLDSDVVKIFSDYFETNLSQASLGNEILLATEGYAKTILRISEEEEKARARINALYGEQYDTAAATAAMAQLEKERVEEIEALRQRGETGKFDVAKGIENINQQFDLRKLNLKVKFGILTPEEAARQKDEILHWATVTIADVNRQIKEDLKKQGFTDEMISTYLITPEMQSSGIPEIEKTVITSWRQATESIERFNRLKAAGNEIDEQQLQNVIAQQKGWYAVAVALGIVDQLKEKSSGRKGADPEEQRIKDIISMLKRMRTEYAKLRDEYDEKTANKRLIESFTPEATDLKVSDYISTMTFDTEGIISGIQKIMDSTADEYDKFWNEFLSVLNAEVELDIKVKNRAAIQDEIDDIFSDYEMTLEIQKLGGDVTWADLFGIDWTSLSDVQTEADQAIAKLTEMGGNKAQEDIKKIQDRVHAAIENEQKTWIKKFTDILAKSMDDIEAVQKKGLRGINVAKQFFDEGQLSAEQYAYVIKYIVSEVNEETSKITLDKFKQSSDYIQAMGDMSAYSTSELQRLLDRLKEVVAASAGNMDAENLKTYMDAIQNVQDALDQRKSPIQKNRIAQVQELNRLEADFAAEQERQNTLLQEQEIWTQRVADAQARLNALKEKQKGGDDSQETADAISQADADLIDATENLQNANNEVKTSQANLSSISSKIGNIIGDVSAAMFKIQETFYAVIDGLNGAIEIFGNISELADSVGIDTEKGGWSDAKIFFDSLGEASQNATQAFQNFATGNIAGGIANSVGFVTDIIKFFNQIHDNKREQIIIAETEKVEKLADDYADLEKTIDKALDVSDLQRYDAQLTENFRKQQLAYDKMIAAEKDKKNPDEDRIKQWEQDSKDLAEGFSENIEEALIQAGGVAQDDIINKASNFVDAWVKAFQETGDGLSGLEDNFDEFFINVLKQQASMAISKRFVKPIIDDLNAALDDYKLDDSEAQTLYDKAMATMPEWSKFLEEWFKPFLGMIGNTEEGSLSGLQKGIQGVTEETAQIIEALLNSMRYYVADSNAQIRNIYLMLSGNESIPNPMLAELRLQTEQIRAINRLIRNVTASGHPNGGDGIKVFMN